MLPTTRRKTKKERTCTNNHGQNRISLTLTPTLTLTLFFHTNGWSHCWHRLDNPPCPLARVGPYNGALVQPSSCNVGPPIAIIATNQRSPPRRLRPDGPRQHGLLLTHKSDGPTRHVSANNRRSPNALPYKLKVNATSVRGADRVAPVNCFPPFNDVESGFLSLGASFFSWISVSIVCAEKVGGN